MNALTLEDRFTVTLPGLIAAADVRDRYEPTPKGAAAARYLQAKEDFNEEVTNSCRFTADGCPDYDTTEVVAAGIIRDVAATIYVIEHGGCICEDCGDLEGCCCPDC